MCIKNQESRYKNRNKISLARGKVYDITTSEISKRPRLN
jgi:hypothetical protein